MPAAVTGALYPEQPVLPAPETPDRSNCPSLTHIHAIHVHTLSYHAFTHTLSLTPVLPAAMFSFWLTLFDSMN